MVAALAVVGILGASCGSDEPDLASTAAPATTAPTELLDAPTPAAVAGDDDDAIEAPSSPPEPTAEVAPEVELPPGAIELLRPEVIETYPHDITAYTQGFEIHDGRLLESTGRQGHPGGDEIYGSDLRLVDIESGAVVQSVDAPDDVFAEGLTRVGDELFQLTWLDERAFTWDADTFEFRREFRYEGQGWGLCYDGTRLVMTDGSSTMFFRDPVTFELIGRVQVTQQGTPLERLNELECVGDRVWANVWQTDYVVRIDPETGAVDGLVNGSALEQPRTAPTEVLNGIAFDDASGTWLMTGKFWPTVYRVRFVSEGVIGG